MAHRNLDKWDADNLGNFLDGKMTEYFIVNGALSTMQLNALYQNHRTYWAF